MDSERCGHHAWGQWLAREAAALCEGARKAMAMAYARASETRVEVAVVPCQVDVEGSMEAWEATAAMAGAMAKVSGVGAATMAEARAETVREVAAEVGLVATAALVAWARTMRATPA